MKNLKITHYLDKPRTVQGTFTKKKLKSVHKLFITDVITIMVMSVVIYHAFIPKIPLESAIIASNGCKGADCTIAVNQAKQDVIQAQIDQLNVKMQTLHKQELDLQ